MEEPTPKDPSDLLNFGDYTPLQWIIVSFLVLAVFDFLVQSGLIIYIFVTQNLNWRERRWTETVCCSLVTVLFTFARILIVLMTAKTVLKIDFEDYLPLGQGDAKLDSVWEAAFVANLCIGLWIWLLYVGACVGCIFKIKRGKMQLIDLNPGSSRPYVINLREERKHSSLYKELPIVTVVMPIYNEDPQVLIAAVESVIQCEYPPDKKWVFLAFDDNTESELYLKLVERLGIPENQGGGYPPRVEITLQGVRLTISRYPHGGKRSAQGQSFELIRQIFSAQSDNVNVLFIDSDIVLEPDSILNFVGEMNTNPKIQAATGLVTCDPTMKLNTYQHFQDCEYIQGQIFSRALEELLGAVTCLPGALTMIRLPLLQLLAPRYFVKDEVYKNGGEYHRFYLGEDRFLTFLIMEQGKELFQVRFLAPAKCTTETPENFSKLLKQRRRWFLGGISNDLAMLASPIMWVKYPGVIFLKCYNYCVKGLDWLFFPFLLRIYQGFFTDEVENNDLAFNLGILGLIVVQFLLLIRIAVLLKRPRMLLMAILLFFVTPFFNLIVMVYSILTWNVRSWGGPRTDNENPEDSNQINIKTLS